MAELGVQISEELITYCVWLSVIEPDVISKDRTKCDDTGDQEYVEKAHWHGKVGWNVGRRAGTENWGTDDIADGEKLERSETGDGQAQVGDSKRCLEAVNGDK